jgi:hypothetical protein
MFRQGDVIAPIDKGADLECPVRVLLIDRELEAATVIALSRTSEAGRLLHYVPMPQRIQISVLAEMLSAGVARVCSFDTPPHWSMTDSDYVSAAPNEKEKKARTERLKKRDLAYEKIVRYVRGLSIECVIRSLPTIVGQIKENSTDSKTAKATIRSLNLYVMSLGRTNALTPQTERCGAPGKRKSVTTSTGRPRKDKLAGNYVMSDDDKQNAAIGMQLCATGTPQRDAYAAANIAFWSDWNIDEHGRKSISLWEPNERPSFEQFVYWGGKESLLIKRKLFDGLKTEKQTSRVGSSSGDTHAVGVLMEFDSTSSDVYLTSVETRLRALPPMKRYVIKCPVSSAVLGFHLDWAAPSPTVALRTILAAAMDKGALCQRFGVECGIDRWPGIVASSYRADNGELKAKKITDAEKEFNFSIEYTKSHSGESKPNVESQHKSDHVRLDHKLSGTTHGRQKKRGEKEPQSKALLNYYEFMHLQLTHYLRWNDELVPERAPIAMLKQGIEPTRINIFKWYRDTHQISQRDLDVTSLQAFTLPEWPAVIKEDGIHLKSEDGTRTLRHVRYYSPALKEDRRFKTAASRRISLNLSVRVDSTDISKIYVPIDNRICEIPNVTNSDPERMKGGLADLIDSTDAILNSERKREPSRQQQEASASFERGQIESDAKRQKTKALEKSKDVSRSTTRDSLRQNSKQESANVIAQSLPAVAKRLGQLEETKAIESVTTEPTEFDAYETSISSFLDELIGASGND